VSGRGTLWLGAGFAFLGAGFDSPAFYVPGVALALLGVGLWAWVRFAAATTRLRQLPGPRTVVEDEPYPAQLELSGPRLVPGAALTSPALARPLRLGMRLPPSVDLEASFPRRGRHSLHDAKLTIADPLGLWSAEVQAGGRAEVLVLPRTSPVVSAGFAAGAADESDAEGPGRGVGTAGIDTGAVEFEPDGLRPYREGTPASRIHWPAVARTGELLEHKLVSGGRAAPLLVLDAFDPIDEAALDAAVRATASLALHLGKAGGCGVLLPGEARPLELDSGLRVWPELHARLALVEPSAARPLRRRPPRGDRVYWISARAELPASPSRAARGWGGGFWVSPLPLPGRRTEFTVAGCHVQRLEPARGRPAGKVVGV
jgi:uncharacterized protein (DUF58 family)